MAIAFTNLGASANPDINDSPDASVFTNTSWTPPTDGIIVVFVEARDALGLSTPTISGNSLTWTQIGSTLDCGDGDNGLALFAADASGATTGITTITYSRTQIHCTASFFQATGVDISGGLAAAFVQQPNNTGNGASGEVTLAAADDVDNRPIVCFWHKAWEDTTFRTNWTEVDDLSEGGQIRGIETQYRDDAFETTASATWITSDADWAGMAAELKAVSIGVAANINISPGASYIQIV